jgi:hypothetical protein
MSLLSTPSIESRTSWIVSSIVLLIMTLTFGAPWILIVALKPVAAEFGGRVRFRAASALAWFGRALGGILMSRAADVIGVRWVVIFSAVMICSV